MQDFFDRFALMRKISNLKTNENNFVGFDVNMDNMVKIFINYTGNVRSKSSTWWSMKPFSALFQGYFLVYRKLRELVVLIIFCEVLDISKLLNLKLMKLDFYTLNIPREKTPEKSCENTWETHVKRDLTRFHKTHEKHMKNTWKPPEDYMIQQGRPHAFSCDFLHAKLSIHTRLQLKSHELTYEKPCIRW